MKNNKKTSPYFQAFFTLHCYKINLDKWTQLPNLEMEEMYLGNKYEKEGWMIIVSTRLGLLPYFQPHFSLAFYFTHLSSELNSFSHLYHNDRIIFCYLNSRTLIKLWFFNSDPMYNVNKACFHQNIFFKKSVYLFPKSLCHASLCQDSCVQFFYSSNHYIH